MRPDDPSKNALGGATPALAIDTGNAERRTIDRSPLTAAAEVVELSSGVRFSVRISDVGLGGCYVDMINPLPLGTSVKILITHAQKTFESPAFVVYVHPGVGMGLAFTQFEPDQLEVLEQWSALSNDLGPSSDAPAATSSGRRSKTNECRVLNDVICLLTGKRLLSEDEGVALLRKLFR